VLSCTCAALLAKVHAFGLRCSLVLNFGMTPFIAVYGCDQPNLIKYELQNSDPSSLHAMLTEGFFFAQLKSNLMLAQQAMKKFADSKRRLVEFNIGDMVLVKLQPYRKHSLTLHRNQKLGLRYFGSFPIIESYVM